MRWFSQRRSPSPLGGHAMVSFVAAYCVRPTAHALLCIVNGDDSAVFRFFVPGDLDLLPLTLTFELGRDFCTLHLIAKFRYPTFNLSEVIVRTSKHADKLTNKQTPLKTSTLLRYTTPVSKRSQKLFESLLATICSWMWDEIFTFQIFIKFIILKF